MQESLEPMPFPLHGLSILTELESQPPGTTPEGTNVRAYESLTQRNRGGSRAGLGKYIGTAVAAAKIQHVNSIVWTTLNAVPPMPSGAGTITDPSTNNLSKRNTLPRTVRSGGSGVQPIRSA